MSASAQVALPARWGRFQRRKNTLLYWALRGVAAVVRRLPRPLIVPLGYGLGHLAYLGTLPWQGPWLEQIKTALGADARARTILRRMFVHLAHSALELGHLDALVAEAVATEGSLERLQRASQRGGAVIVSGHIGHWELLAQWAAYQGLPAVSVAKPLYDPRLTAWVAKERSRTGLELIWRGQSDGPMALLRALRQRKLLALLVDQDMRVPGLFVPFFGRLAHTPLAPVRLALKRNVPLLVAYAHRQDGRHRIHVDEVTTTYHDVDGDELGDDARAYALLTAINAHLEAAIRTHPEQWVWLHRRWRRQPANATRVPGGMHAEHSLR